MDVVVLSRFQFAFTVAYHFLFVPLSIGLGLIMALAQTRAYRSGDAADQASARFWVRLFTTTFAVGVATGITMEFAFGTNWADYSRFVGDIFGAPLAAEALFAFFLESTFLGVVLFGRDKVSPKFYLVASWLVWAGSLLSALWILIANSWMQTPAGYEIAADGSKAVLTDFWAAAFNPSVVARYAHTIIALIIMGAFVAIAIGAYHMRNGKGDFGKKTLATGTVVAIVACVLMIPAMHQQAVVVANEQPEKLAAMEGQYEEGPVGMYVFGWVDEANETVVGIEVPIGGMTSILASGDPSTSYIGLHQVQAKYGETAPVQIVFQAYHLMVAMFGAIGVWIILSLVATLRVRKGAEPSRGLLKALMFAPLFPFVAIQTGWMVTEVGRQPWIVWEELRTADAISQSVDATQLLITIALFVLVYAFILVMYLRVALGIIKEGPVTAAIESSEAKGAN
ncbi:cytochrome BD ubiquinol oxidase subunit I [Denitrobacterium detoxificans]|uniref:Cytochrome bd-I ubiquinol oxidase subunit 1 apoprotein n=1 Tax=Denitrobacterium detoxificans TaxID=79604 RepID=A0A172RWI3_9ACTN|nr:cytochrome ubiquinol oxidase subunit I [Denitrobacterium detoxificans]ANE22082.1 cytochrome BD ubiquinol oxidase subunit I [Denitrobacterium detoxificans]SEO89399.1 cytochrome bd-I ubiquinol oxidase subunit 1 apoprotein [Denitrobacterium detoxificans]